MKKVSKYEIDSLKQKFPAIQHEQLREAVSSAVYNHTCTLSIFDHWLTEEEADNEVITFFDITPNNKNRYDLQEQKLVNFYREVVKHEKPYIFIEDENEEIGEYFTPSTEKEYETSVIAGIREKQNCRLLLLNQGVIINSAFDMTADIYFIDLRTKSALEYIAQKNGLFLLS